MKKHLAAVLAVMGSLGFALPGRSDDVPAATDRFPAFRLGAFADLVWSHPTGPGGKDRAAGEVDLYASSRLANNWSALGEVLIRHTGSVDNIDLSANTWELNLERLYVTYNPSDQLRVEIGQIHTGIIQWNEREHRSQFLQTPIDVPAIARRESQRGAWPLHFDGAWVSGRVPGSLGAEYGVGFGAARGSERDNIQPLFRHGISPAALFLVSVAPDALTGFEAGTSGYVGHIRAPGITLRELDATVFSSFVRGGIEFRGEWARMVHSQVGGPAEFVTRGWYVLGSFRPRGRWKPFRPYVLIDSLHVAQGEQYLADVREQDGWSAGLRWDLSSRLAIKTEFRSQALGAESHRHFIRTEFALAF